MQSKLTELIKKHEKNVDYLEIRLESSDITQIRYFGKALDTVNQVIANGGYVRSCYKGSWGFCSFNDNENLEKYIEDSISQARLLGSEINEKTILSKVKPTVKIALVKPNGKDPRNI